jgi:hypothetical protein
MLHSNIAEKVKRLVGTQNRGIRSIQEREGQGGGQQRRKKRREEEKKKVQSSVCNKSLL